MKLVINEHRVVCLAVMNLLNNALRTWSTIVPLSGTGTTTTGQWYNLVPLSQFRPLKLIIIYCVNKNQNQFDTRTEKGHNYHH